MNGPINYVPQIVNDCIRTTIDKENSLCFVYWPTNEAVMSFKVLEIVGLEEAEPEFQMIGAMSSDQTTLLMDAAECLFWGHITAMGEIHLQCSTFFYDNCNPGNYFKLIFDRLYGYAAELMPLDRKYLLET